ncbi:glycosyltransferase [Gemmobacter fulvus]|uniref:Glycosyltransferase n=1 Tax=Gemmobacter fulvus TaxID=2840474 RepID=A0A975P5M4_9RHOB|nr:glycosyltransferase [Gemmobacter fulvus]MBT9247434.1 glycosyltransferase [Gemmobacter fulvus]QWK90089.1 glycosyltransferase [Gemmobacter fulvus]
MAIPRLQLLPDPVTSAAVALPGWQAREAAPSAETLAVVLLRAGLVAPHDMVQALTLHRQRRGRLADILLSRGMISETALYRAMAQHWGADLADVQACPPDPRLIDALGAATCLRESLLPWRRLGDVTVIATAHPEDFARNQPRLHATFGKIALAVLPANRIEAAILLARGPQLDHAAQRRVAAAESCRDWGGQTQGLWARCGVILLASWAVLAPFSLLCAATFWAMLTLLLATLLKTAAIFAALRRPPPEGPPVHIQRLPIVSVMVALYREGTIAPRLVQRLGLLDYPRELLDILLVVEEEDSLTRAALQRACLPPWMRVVVVPDGRLKTKPRALNYALDACRGSIIGVYDAEDAPEPDQIRRVVDRFHHRGAEVACLQGVLDFYNPHTNWLSRCFTMEYATWFRIILPGLERLGLAIPLGGTTLFFRRAALEQLGGWDAFNVTEDADLGMRLARHGFRTELIATTTFEEANCRVLPWVRQRSRWLKGYMMTYAVHMRQPALLLRQLGWWKFIGFQVFFLTTLSQFLLAPLLWTFWAVPLGLPHPLVDSLPPLLYDSIATIFLFTEVMLLAVTLVSLRMTPNRIHPLWAPVLHLYFPLGSLASYKAAWELVTKPFWWDKTSHGHFAPPEMPAPSAASAHPHPP